MNDDLLRITSLACGRGGMALIEGLSLRLSQGQGLALRGPNGVGKTSLLRVIAGLAPPSAGEVIGGGAQAAYAGHADGVKPTLSVSENLAFWAAIYGGGDLDRALHAFGLGALRHRAAGSLSAGQRRRLGLARLLVTGRKLWLLDEPTVSLDAASVALFARALQAHLASGGAALVATHVDLGLPMEALDLAAFRAAPQATRSGAFDEAFE